MIDAQLTTEIFGLYAPEIQKQPIYAYLPIRTSLEKMLLGLQSFM